MKVQSAIYPERYWIRKIELGDVFIKLRKNINEIKSTFENQVYVIYEYDEVEIKIVNRPSIEDYIENNLDDLFNKGLKEENKPKEPTNEDRIQQLEDAILFLLDNNGGM